MNRLLFILKKREMTSEEDSTLGNETKKNFKYCISSGLRNSAMFVVDMLNSQNVETKLVEVIDNNDIDREVTLFKPTHVIIEAYWVVPEKFVELGKLHPNVKWIVRNHSEMPFLALEGIAVDWTLKYIDIKNVYVAPNSKKSYDDVIKMVAAKYTQKYAEDRILYLPNFYKIEAKLANRKKKKSNVINIGCFGAVRPLKNHMLQAIAAITYAKKHNLILNFHINVARIEDKGNSVLKSVRSLFAALNPAKFRLIEHGWFDHKDFLELVSQMDLGLQVSFTESFNIVAADFVSCGIPIVVSPEIFWLPKHFYVDDITDTNSIVTRIERVLLGYNFLSKNKIALDSLISYNKASQKIWIKMFK